MLTDDGNRAVCRRPVDEDVLDGRIGLPSNRADCLLKGILSIAHDGDNRNQWKPWGDELGWLPQTNQGGRRRLLGKRRCCIAGREQSKSTQHGSIALLDDG